MKQRQLMATQVGLRSIRWCDRKKSSSTHLRRISRKRPTVEWKGFSTITTPIKVLMVWLQLHLHPQDFQCCNKINHWYSQQFAGHTTCKWRMVEPKYKWKWTIYSAIIVCFAVDIILQVEETSRYYQYYYQHMGTLLDSTPEVPDDGNLKCFLVWWLLSKRDSLTNHW